MTDTFVMFRSKDISGVSGTGPVANGAVFEDGTTVLHWNPRTATPNVSSTVIYGSIRDCYMVHGHGGASRFFWDDHRPAKRHKVSDVMTKATHLAEGGTDYAGSPMWMHALLDLGYLYGSIEVMSKDSHLVSTEPAEAPPGAFHWYANRGGYVAIDIDGGGTRVMGPRTVPNEPLLKFGKVRAMLSGSQRYVGWSFDLAQHYIA